jgi:hypothetical protein
MTLYNVVAARKEAERFCAEARNVEALAKSDSMIFFGTRETGMLRRASMDLTRSLADLRRSPQAWGGKR